jgi:group II intron reverse transcriptase/maturase
MIETRVGVGVFLSRIRDSLKSGEFAPVEVRQVMIPKGDTGKFRKLGIPTVADRVVQASLKAVLEPIFEADFKPCSYGFRPNRRAHDAIAEIHHFGTRGYQWVLEADIKACFDEISHTALMDRLRVRIKDKRVCALVKAFLKSGIFTELGDREESPTGTPQGGILSPLLANIALSALDDHFDRQWHQQMGTSGQRCTRTRHGQGNWRLIRYADLCRVRHKSHYAARRVMPSAVVKVLVSGGWGGGGLGIIRACDPVGSPSGCGKADSLQPATAGTAPTSGVEIRPSTCRNRSNERVAVTSVLADQTRTHRRL